MAREDSASSGARKADERMRPPNTAARGARDLNNAPVVRTLLAFAIPVMISNMLQQANVVVNSIWVSRLLGHGALAAIFNANLMMTFLIGCMSGLAMAATVLIGQAIGAGDNARLQRASVTCGLFFITLSVILTFTGIAIAPWLLGVMDVPTELRPQALSYLSVIFYALPSMFLFSYLQMAMRAAGDPRTPLYASFLAVGLDIVLNPLLISGAGPLPHLGVLGSALSTLISQTISLLLLVGLLYWRGSFLAPRLADLRAGRPDLDIVRRLFTLGVPMGLTTIVVTASSLAMVNLVNHYGVATSAAYAAATQLWIYVQAPGSALGAGATAIAAQAIGAGRWDRVDEVARRGMILGFLLTFFPVVLIYIFNRQVMSLFLVDPDSLRIAQQVNHHALWGFVCFSMSITLTSIQRAAGAVMVPFLFIFTAMWLVRIPLAAETSRYFGVEALWWSFPFASVTVLICSGLYYTFGPWRPRGEAAQAEIDTAKVA